MVNRPFKYERMKGMGPRPKRFHHPVSGWCCIWKIQMEWNDCLLKSHSGIGFQVLQLLFADRSVHDASVFIVVFLVDHILHIMVDAFIFLTRLRQLIIGTLCSPLSLISPVLKPSKLGSVYSQGVWEPSPCRESDGLQLSWKTWLRGCREFVATNQPCIQCGHNICHILVRYFANDIVAKAAWWQVWIWQCSEKEDEQRAPGDTEHQSWAFHPAVCLQIRIQSRQYLGRQDQYSLESCLEHCCLRWNAREWSWGRTDEGSWWNENSTAYHLDHWKSGDNRRLRGEILLLLHLKHRR